MIAKRIPSILPKMTLNESLEVTKIYSLYEGNGNNSLVTERPFRMPHHNVSMNAMIGGGRNATPGEITLAHNGVLFLDELPQFDKRTLEALRQPVEDGKVTISRVEENHDYPSKFMLVAAMNPCPCGYYGDQKCTCSINDVKNYRKRISGPIIERLDIQKYVNTVNILSSTEKQTDSSEEIKIKIMNTRIIQEERFKNLEGISVNSQIPDSLIKEYCRLDKESTQILVNIQKKFKYSARSINKILKIARTHADFNQRKDIIADDVIFAISARDMDHEYL
jgi:magnesium chelatase family protein